MSNLRLRTQMTLFFVLQTGVLLLAAGIYMNWQLRRIVERELGERLVALAQVAAAQVIDTPVFALLPGDEQSRTSLRLRREFEDFGSLAGLSRVLIADAQQRVFFDSRGELAIGSEYVRLRFDAAEIGRAMSGTPVASPLFYDEAGQPFKAAYAPLAVNGVPGGVVCVESSAASLAAVAKVRNTLLTIGGLAVLGAALSAGFISRQVTRPLDKLKEAAEAIGRGDYQTAIAKAGTIEVAFLSSTIDEMRKAILRREQRQQMMLAGIAHEIRNPLGGIELFAGLLHKQSPQSLLPSVEKILGEVRRLKQIVQDFLDYARPAEPRAALGGVAVQAAVDEARELLGDLADGIDWQVTVESTLHAQVDADHLRRILLNLLRNACEALKLQVERRIQISAARDGAQVYLTIADNGPGIAPEIRERIFEPFFTTRHDGTGLGLALVKLLVEENGGAVELLKTDCGSVLRVSFKVA